MKHRGPRRAHAVLIAVALGCTYGHVSHSLLALDAVEPASAVAGVAVAIRLHGRGFRPVVVADLGGKGAASDPLSARVGDAVIADAVLRADDLIEGTLPNTLAPGTYPVSVSLGDRQAEGTATITVLAPIDVALSAPADLASGEERQFSLQITSRAPASVKLAVDAASVAPGGAAGVSGLSLPASVGPEPVAASGKLTSLRPAAAIDAALALGVRWTLGPVSGVVSASATLRAFGPPRATGALNAPAEIELGDERAISAQLAAPAELGLGQIAVRLSAGGAASIGTNFSLSGGTLAAGGTLPLQGTVRGAAIGAGSVAMNTSANAARGDPPAPLSFRQDLVVRQGPAPALSALSLPGIVEVGLPFPVQIGARNDGDVGMPGVRITVSAAQGTVTPGSVSLDLAAGASAQKSFSVVPALAGQPVQLTVSLAGPSALSGRTFSAQPASAVSGPARKPAALALTAAPAQTLASVGQQVALSVQISNSGEVDVPAAVISIAASGSGRVLDGAGNPVASLQLAAVAVPAGRSVTLNATALGASAAVAGFKLSVAGTDPVSGVALSASATASFDVRAGPLLTVTASGPPRLVSGQSGTIDVSVRNDGGTDALTLSAAAQVSGPAGASSPAPASVARLATGATVHFSVPLLAGAPAGSASVSLSVSASDANGAGPVSGAAPAVIVAVQDPPRITASFPASLPATATESQTLPVTMLRLTAAGSPSADAQLAVLPVLSVTGGTATAQAPCTLPCALPAGGTLDVPVQIVAGTAGSLQATASFPQSIVDAVQGAPVTVPPVSTTQVAVQTAAALSIALQAPQLVEGFRSTFTATISNTGGAQVSGLAIGAIDLTIAGGAKITPASVSALPSGPLAGGGHVSFTFDVIPPTGAGTLTVHLHPTGTETNTGAARAADYTSAALTVLPPGGLVANLSSLPATVSVGQSLSLTVSVTNTGGTAVNSAIASLSQRSAVGDGTVTITGPTQAAQTIAAGASANFTFQITVTAKGPLRLTGSASGTLAGGGAATVTPSSQDLVAQAPAKLSATLVTDRTRVSTGQTLKLTLTVQNTGEANANNVTAATPSTAAGSTATVGAITAVAAGALAVLRGGQSATFTWSTSATSAGQVSFVSSAQGTDGNDATQTPTTGSVQSASVQAQTPGQLALSSAATPARISAGLQQATLTLTVSNPGGADVTLAALPAPVAITTGNAAVSVATQPASAAGTVLTSGGSKSFVWTFNASGSGTVSWSSSASATESNTGATISPAAVTSGSVAVDAPAALSISLSATPARVSAGLQQVQVTLKATNSGGAALRFDPLPAPTLLVTGTAAATVATSPAPAGGTLLAGGATQSFTWSYNVSGSGTLAFSASASGVDANSGTARSASAGPTPTVQAQAPGALSANAAATPSLVSAGLQQVSLALTARNTGEAGVQLNALPAPTVSGAAGAALASSPPSPAGTVLAGGASQTFTWVWNVSGSGTLTFTASCSGTDVNAGNTLGPSSATAAPVTVQKPAALTVSSVVVSPSPAALGGSLDVAVTVQNTGEATATQVQPAAISGSATATQSGSASAVNIAGAASAVFHVPFSTVSQGNFTASSGASGTEGNAGTALSAPPVSSAAIIITATQAAITSPSAGATLQPGGSLTAVASGWNPGGQNVTQLTLAATGSGSVGTPATISPGSPRNTLGSTFVVSANTGAAAGSTITLVASATDALGATVSSAPLVITIGPPTVVQLYCRPQEGLTLGVNQGVEARLEELLSDGTFRDATVSASWSSSPTATATVSAGVVRGVAAGDATVTATDRGLSASCAVHVVATSGYGIRPADPILLGLKGTLPLQLVQYTGTLNPSPLSANWTSSSSTIAAVSGSGVVTGKSAGTATITGCSGSTNCASTVAIVGDTLDMPGTLSYRRFAIGSSQTFNSLSLRAGTTTSLADEAAPLILTVSSFLLEAGASLVGNGGTAPAAVSDSSVTATGEGGGGSTAAAGGGGGGGNGSHFCGGANCGGGGLYKGANGDTGCILSLLGGICAGGTGAQGSSGGKGASGALLLSSPGDGGGGGGMAGAGGQGGSKSSGNGYITPAGGAGTLDGKTGGNGGGGGNTSGGPGGGGGGGAGAIFFDGNASASIRIDGLVSLEGGGGAMLRSATNAGPGGAGSGGSFFVNAASGQVTGSGTVSVRGGLGGGGSTGGSCGGGGGGGGGIVQITAPVAGPQLATLIEGGVGGAACGGGGAAGESGAIGQLKRP
jgi:hypothetical protein